MKETFFPPGSIRRVWDSNCTVNIKVSNQEIDCINFDVGDVLFIVQHERESNLLWAICKYGFVEIMTPTLLDIDSEILEW